MDTEMNTHHEPSVIGRRRIVQMANQIGDFFQPYPPERRAEGIRNHLRTYWDPRMREELLEMISIGGYEIDRYVVKAAKLLMEPENIKPGYYGPPKLS
jgi:formate dehydrogenase subunit delta